MRAWCRIDLTHRPTLLRVTATIARVRPGESDCRPPAMGPSAVRCLGVGRRSRPLRLGTSSTGIFQTELADLGDGQDGHADDEAQDPLLER